ncbi:MAG: tRNA pseudouridine(55) synthase TruB [bacterium]
MMRDDLKAANARKAKKESKRPCERHLQGILPVNKDVGLTSHDVVQRVRRIFGIRQVGHAGTLDPVASGVLVVLVGSATRIAQYLQEDDKEYHLTLYLGRETDTQDITGTTIGEADPSGVTLQELESAIDRYRGSFLQVPPAYSAVKRGGQPLYRLARQGQTVKADPRKVTIYSIEMDGWDPPRASLKVQCSKGTYMRTLCHDIGRDLEVFGCMESLVRVRSGAFHIDDTIELDKLRSGTDPEKWLRNAASGLSFPEFEPEDADLAGLLQGRPVSWSGDQLEGMVSVVRNGCLVALVSVGESEGRMVIEPRRILKPAKELLNKNYK